MLRLYALLFVVTPLPYPQAIEPPAWACRQVCQDLDLLDQSEEGWYFRDQHDVYWSLQAMRRRREELKDCPPLIDARRFPEAELLLECLQHNKAIQEEIKKWMEIDSAQRDSLGEYLRELETHHELYWHMWQAKCGWSAEWKRKYLQKLRDELIPDCYYGGPLPAHVPVRFLQVID